MDQPLQPTNLAIRFGGDSELDAILTRIAAIFHILPEQIKQFPDVHGALLGASQWMWTYGAMPQRHMYLLPHNTKYERTGARGEKITDWRIKYTLADSYEFRMGSAKITAREEGLYLRPEVIEIPIEKIAAISARLGITDGYHGGPYHADDVLYRARIRPEQIRPVPGQQLLTRAEENERAQNLPWHWGWWKRNANRKRGENVTWEADNIPHARTRDWVATKRALKSAYAQDYGLRPVEGWVQLDDRIRLRRIHEEIEQPVPASIDEQLNQALFAPRPDIHAEIDAYGGNDTNGQPNPLTMSLYA